MTKTVAVLLGTGFVALVIVIALLITILINGCPKVRRVEIIAPDGTQVFARLSDDSEQHLGDLVEESLTVDVQVDATIILRYKDQEKIFPSEEWEGIKLVEEFDSSNGRARTLHVVAVSINAVPWAEVYIKLPETDRFVKPAEKKSNITPIRGGLKVPTGTAIRLVYGDSAKTFSYDVWKDNKTISYDFSKP